MRRRRMRATTMKVKQIRTSGRITMLHLRQKGASGIQMPVKEEEIDRLRRFIDLI
jgi:hypothetical protein